MKDLSIFAQRLKEARERCGLRQNALAEKVHVTPQTISAYEKAETGGKGKNPTLENAVAIAAELGVSLDWLCGIEKPQSQEYKAINTLGDAARYIIQLTEIGGISLESMRYTETITEIDRSTGYPETHEVTHTAIALLFKYGELEKFLSELERVRTVCNSIDMGDTLYHSWLQSRLSALDSKLISENDPLASVELDDDGELPF